MPVLLFWIAIVALLGCLGVDVWTYLYRPNDFLTSVCITLLVVIAGFVGAPKRTG